MPKQFRALKKPTALKRRHKKTRFDGMGLESLPHTAWRHAFQVLECMHAEVKLQVSSQEFRRSASSM